MLAAKLNSDKLNSAKLNTDGRRSQRIRCRIRATLQFMGQTLDIRILDISRTGMALQLEGWIEAKRGATVVIRCPELGHIEGSVRWYRAGKMGLEFEQTSNTVAQITAYFRHFHRDPPKLAVV
ncbi:PilZ domain-containing protein [Rhizobium sp. AQ_MP]|uniref:PilZ domain-containing protein n=1 Tax=Rhizobium sp. AQ_MP TaxID=2761536 RepID=UPI00163988E8|nr:PilZ domain-containing protein [Rhizobium sp. AQ_MP]MBC2773929.1 PilZ domain-containing protein [Rhizobium sp. AQ_MP]